MGFGFATPFGLSTTGSGFGSSATGVGSTSEEDFDSALVESFLDPRCSWVNKLLSIDPTATGVQKGFD